MATIRPSRNPNRVRFAVLALAASAMVTIPASPAAADVIVVDLSSDTTNGGDGLTSLREAVSEASGNGVDDTIVLAASTTYTLSDCLNGAVTNTGDENLTIQGGVGTEIHQSCSDVGILSSTSTAATLSVLDVTLTGSPTTGTHLDGAAVWSDGKIVLDGVTIENVEAGPGGTVVDSSFGAATTITITDSTVTGNQGTAVSGDFVSVTITGTTITDNIGSGVALVDGSPLTITDSTITGNTGRGASTTGQGNTVVTVSGSTISDNGNGGISCSACQRLTVDDTTVDGNGATANAGLGGGITFTYDYDPVPDAPGVTITDTTVTDNRANRPGGGISVGLISKAFNPMTQPTTHIAGSSITGNYTVGSDQHGGGIHLATTSAIIENSTIADNTAADGLPAGTARGGGLYMAETTDDGIADDRDLILNNTVISGNSAPQRGGGAYLSLGGRLESTGLQVTNNESGTDGGGLLVNMPLAFVDHASFAGNSAERGAGMAVVGSGSSEVHVDSSTFATGTASDSGGGLWTDDGTVELVNSTVSGNSAANGGGIGLGIEGLDDPQTVVLDSSTVFSNTATNGSNVWGAGLRTSAALIVGGIGGADCTDGSVDAAGYTFTDDAACAGAATDVVSSDDPLLGPLADNGGGTLTHLPAEDSPIGGVVPAASCTQPVDQRGVSRPQGAGCEPGSVEIVEEPPAPPMNIIDGTPLSDLLIGTDAPDRISGLASTDLLLGLGGDDELYGGDGADLIGGGAGDDLLEGGPGGDLLVGEAGADELRGGAGNDFLVGDASDTFDGGPGLDICIRPGAITLC